MASPSASGSARFRSSRWRRLARPPWRIAAHSPGGMIRATPSRRSPRRARVCWRSIPPAGRTALVRRRSGGTVSAITCCRSWAAYASTASPRPTSWPCCCRTGRRSTRRCAASSSGSAGSSAGPWPRATGRTIPPEPRSTRPCPGTDDRRGISPRCRTARSRPRSRRCGTAGPGREPRPPSSSWS